MKVLNATEAFEGLCYEVVTRGLKRESPKGTWYSLFNVGITIANPLDNLIKTEWRKFNPDYARKEFSWYLSKDTSVTEIGKHAKLWNDIAENGQLNSNYGDLMWQNNQWENCKKRLKEDKVSRQAIITLYDGKKFLGMDSKDIPCTLNLGFRIVRDHLNLSVTLRSNDLWFGLASDIPCFTWFQEMMAKELGIPVGTYYHYAMDMHLYSRHYERAKEHLKIESHT